jgi:hypothetical protein
MELKEAIARIYKEMKGRLGIQNQPSVFLNHDEENSKDIFGRTAYYSPGDQSIVLYITNRHPKDICRSFAHELIHHHQNERGDLDLGDATSPNYAQEDGHMRKMEMEAYLKGNIMFRDFEDNYKKSIREFTGTGASGGNSTDGNDITSPRPFADDDDEKENYMNKNVYGGSGGHYKREPATTGFNRTKFTKFEETMKKSEIHELIKESIKEVLGEIGADAYGDATLTSQGQSKSRFTKTGRPPGIMEKEEEEEKTKEEKAVEILDDVEDLENVTININEEDALVTRGKKIIQILNKPEFKKFKPTFNDFIKDRTKGKFGLPNKINDKTDGDVLALLNLRARDFSNIFK